MLQPLTLHVIIYTYFQNPLTSVPAVAQGSNRHFCLASTVWCVGGSTDSVASLASSPKNAVLGLVVELPSEELKRLNRRRRGPWLALYVPPVLWPVLPWLCRLTLPPPLLHCWVCPRLFGPLPQSLVRYSLGSAGGPCFQSYAGFSLHSTG